MKFISYEKNTQVIKMNDNLNILASLWKISNDLKIINEKLDGFHIFECESKSNNYVINNSKVLCKIKTEIYRNNEIQIQRKPKFKCFWPKCVFETNHSNVLNFHKNIHLSERKYVCDFNGCNKTFKWKSYLIGHKRDTFWRKAIQM